jgi:hypothetical protein
LQHLCTLVWGEVPGMPKLLDLTGKIEWGMLA